MEGGEGSGRDIESVRRWVEGVEESVWRKVGCAINRILI